MATKKKPGKNIPNAQRHTVQVLLRLRPEAARRLRELAAARKSSVSETVADLLDAGERILK